MSVERDHQAYYHRHHRQHRHLLRHGQRRHNRTRVEVDGDEADGWGNRFMVGTLRVLGPEALPVRFLFHDDTGGIILCDFSFL